MEESLLEEYARNGSPEAFRRLADRYGGMVYAAARRQINDSHLAEDIAQAVFIVLAQKAKTIPLDRPLSAWLLTTTRYAAANARRLRQHQLHLESRAGQMQSDATAQVKDQVNDLAPLLDDGISRLRRRDRDALLLRFFEQKPLIEVGRLLGISERAAQKRVSRAVERLRDFFQRRGADVSVVAVTALISASATKAAPAGLSAILGSTVPAAGASMAAAVAKGVMITMAAKKLVAGVAALVVMLLICGTVAIVLVPDSPAPTPVTPNPPAQIAADPADASPPASSWLTTSPTGGLVELIGVAHFPVANEIWWKPDGSPQTDPIPQLFGPQPNGGAQIHGMRRYTLFVRSGVNGRQVAVSPRVQPPGRWEYRRRVAADALVQEMGIIVPEDARQVTFGIGFNLVQVGQQRVFDLPGPALSSAYVQDFAGSGTVKVSAMRDVDGAAQFSAEFIPGATGSFFKNRALSFTAYDANGAAALPRLFKRENVPHGGVVIHHGFESPSAQIARLTCTLTPYEYAEFQGISLEPGTLSSVRVVPLGPANPSAWPQRSTTLPSITETTPSAGMPPPPG